MARQSSEVSFLQSSTKLMLSEKPYGLRRNATI